VTAKYRILVEPRARKHLAGIDPVIRRRIAAKIEALATDPEPPGCKALAGRLGDPRQVPRLDRAAALGDEH
jgi:mRNA-degrading endonuclease RelE of RelBE toxin-antitoxin system